jgi:hypothetical protein
VKPPAGLGRAGKALWRAIDADLVRQRLELDAREVSWLTEACRVADRVAELEAAVDRDGVVASGSKGQPVPHPALREARLQRDQAARLLARLDLPAEDEEVAPGVRRARRAASARVLHQVALREQARRAGRREARDGSADA